MKRFVLLSLLTPFLLLAACDRGPGPGDRTDPTVEITLDGTTNAAGAYTDSVTVTIEAADQGGSGLATTEYRLDGSEDFRAYSEPITVTTPGEYTVEARATDAAGNEGESEETFTVVNSNAPEDEVDPTVSVTLEGTTDATGAYQGSATVAVTAADEGGSGLAAVRYSLGRRTL